MSDHNDNKVQIVIFSFLLVLFLLVVETALWLLQQRLDSLIAYFPLAVLSAQLICQAVFIKGKICNGQRFRLIKANLYLAIYWVGLLLLGALADKRYIPLALMIGASLLLLFAVWQQPKDDIRLQKGLLMFANACGVIALLAYFSILFNLPLSQWLYYSPFSQLLLGIVIANGLLYLSGNRLQQLIALLPHFMLLMLLLNAVYSVIVLVLLHVNLILPTISVMGFVCYFTAHLLMAGLLLWLIFSAKILDFKWLFFLLVITSSFPVLLF